MSTLPRTASASGITLPSCSSGFIQNPRDLLRLEKNVSWNGLYSEALELRVARIAQEALATAEGRTLPDSARSFKYIDTRCLICHEDYAPEDRLTVLPCSHSVHTDCFDLAEKNCPYDRQCETAYRVFIMGNSVLLPTKVQSFIPTLEALLSGFYSTPTKGDPKLHEADEALDRRIPEAIHQDAKSFVSSIVQDIVNAYDNPVIDPPLTEIIESRINQLLSIFKALPEDVRSELIERVMENADMSGFLEKAISWMPALFMHGGANVLLYGEDFIRRIQKRAPFEPIIAEILSLLQEKLYLYHFNKLKDLTPSQMYHYVQNMHLPSLTRFKSMLTGRGETSLRIQKAIQQRERMEKIRIAAGMVLAESIEIIHKTLERCLILSVGFFIAYKLYKGPATEDL